MSTFIDCWVKVAADLFHQALAGEPDLVDSPPAALPAGSLEWVATLAGDEQGQFAFGFDAAILEAPLLGEGVDQKAGWKELLRETLDAACGELLASSGTKCRVEKVEEASLETGTPRAFQLTAGQHSWTILVRDQVRAPALPVGAKIVEPSPPAAASPLTPGLELLLDVELEASLRFGCREMPLGEILDLGPGDVVQLDRHVSDPVDLIVGDKIVARGEVVLVNGNFGLRVTEVSAPKRRLESIRCLF
jgi:flagellar motor switch protein FliN